MRVSIVHLINILVLTTVFYSCDKRLPAEEQKRLQEKANARRIQRVTENQMIEYAQERGSKAEQLLDSLSGQADLIALIQQAVGPAHMVSYITPEEASQNQLSEIMEAYLYNIAEGGRSSANLQKMENGNILFTIPAVEDSAGITILRGLYNIEFIRKEMVNEIFRESDIAE